MDLLRQSVREMVGYVPGEQPKATSQLIKLNTNENPYPPSPRVREAILAELDGGGERLRLYSDPHASALIDAASELYQLPRENILHGNGSDELLALLFRAFLEPNDSIAYPYPTYVLYRTLAASLGTQVHSFDFDASYQLPRALFGSSAKLVLVASPNSPSGNSHPTELLRELARSLPRGVLVVDEAYAAFSDEDALSLVSTEPNVVVLRTFSKSHSLAGMRVGLCLAPAPIIAGLAKVKDSYNLDRLAILAAAASLRDTEWVAESTRRVIATRKRLSAGLQALGWQPLPSQSNFVFARAPGDAEAAERTARGAFEHLKAQGVLVRYFPERLLEAGLRISVGTDEAIDRLLEHLSAYTRAQR